MASVSLRAQIEAHLQPRIPTALAPRLSLEKPTVQSGIVGIEIPLSGLTEICAPAAVSSGKTSLLHSVMAQVTGLEHCCALVDATDSFDPASAAAAGVNLERLLWVRCAPAKSPKKGSTTRAQLQPLEQAFRAADMTLQAGGFTLLAVDLAEIDEKLLQRIPLTTWFRFARAVETMPAALVFLTPKPMARSCAALTLRLRMRLPYWRSTAEISLPHTRLLTGLEIEAEVMRARKAAHSCTSNFSTKMFGT